MVMNDKSKLPERLQAWRSALKIFCCYTKRKCQVRNSYYN